MEIVKNVELDGYKLSIELDVEKLSFGWVVSKRLARDLETNAIVFEESRRELPIIENTLKEMVLKTARYAVDNIIVKEKDNEELQELRNWDGIIKS